MESVIGASATIWRRCVETVTANEAVHGLPVNYLVGYRPTVHAGKDGELPRGARRVQ